MSSNGSMCHFSFALFEPNYDTYYVTWENATAEIIGKTLIDGDGILVFKSSFEFEKIAKIQILKTLGRHFEKWIHFREK